MMDIEDIIAVRQAMGALTPRQSEAVRLRFWEGLRGDALAEAMGVTRQTAHEALTGAIKKMKPYLTN